MLLKGLFYERVDLGVCNQGRTPEGTCRTCHCGTFDRPSYAIVLDIALGFISMIPMVRGMCVGGR